MSRNSSIIKIAVWRLTKRRSSEDVSITILIKTSKPFKKTKEFDVGLTQKKEGSIKAETSRSAWRIWPPCWKFSTILFCLLVYKQFIFIQLKRKMIKPCLLLRLNNFLSILTSGNLSSNLSNNFTATFHVTLSSGNAASHSEDDHEFLFFSDIVWRVYRCKVIINQV